MPDENRQERTAHRATARTALRAAAEVVTPGHRISLTEVYRRIGPAIFGPDWIGKLTERERWLLQRYVDNSRLYNPSSATPGMLTYYDTSSGKPGVPHGVAADVDLARDRRDWMKAQYDRVDTWLEIAGLQVKSATVDADTFQRAFEKAFGRNRRFSTPAIASTEATGPKAGQQSVSKRVVWDIALRFLPDVGRSRKHGWKAELVRQVNRELTKKGHNYQDDSIRKMIKDSLDFWERNHPKTE